MWTFLLYVLLTVWYILFPVRKKLSKKIDTEETKELFWVFSACFSPVKCQFVHQVYTRKFSSHQRVLSNFFSSHLILPFESNMVRQQIQLKRNILAQHHFDHIIIDLVRTFFIELIYFVTVLFLKRSTLHWQSVY